MDSYIRFEKNQRAENEKLIIFKCIFIGQRIRQNEKNHLI